LSFRASFARAREYIRMRIQAIEYERFILRYAYTAIAGEGKREERVQP